jgi:putative endonuclease
MVNKNQQLGVWGEELAEEYLMKNGYKILEKNYKNNYGEIDIITKRKGVIVFIEVKTRSSRSFGLPEEAVNKNKAEKLIKASEKYILDNKIKINYQIDVIAIEKDSISEKIDLRHLKNAVRYF